MANTGEKLKGVSKRVGDVKALIDPAVSPHSVIKLLCEVVQDLTKLLITEAGYDIEDPEDD